jgi:hypothetical protein
LVRALVVVNPDDLIEAFLLLQEIEFNSTVRGSG